MSAPSSSSSSSIPTRSWTYEVFLSFRDEDTGHTFVDHLYKALVQKGILAFKNDKMHPSGKPVSPELLQLIEESRFAVVILSKNYSKSSRCLEELTKIMECQDQMGQIVLPVFYHVDPSDVRRQKRDFATAFEQHEEKLMGKLNNWRKALTATANLSGLHISPESGGESAFIDKIVHEIFRNIQPDGSDNALIGIESHVDTLYSLLSIEASHEVRMIGIFGIEGIGKTTIAQTLFKRIAYMFEGSSFVNNVRDNSCTICLLQEKILKDILRLQQGVMINDPVYGANMIQHRFKYKKVLLVLDDVDAFEQLEYLADTHEWFGPGSRIIITTRDEHLLSSGYYKYKPAPLLMDQAVELFSWHAFRKNSPPDEFKDLSNRAICFTGGVPLALKVLGCFFLGRKNTSVWESALARLANIPDCDIIEKLKCCLDDLR
ncbi:putative TIR domain, P-loop containing nucleoside triphosphate hydrolase [Helianthus annuus]|uniref:Putative toll/interleukin-1 receptor (TIR) domain-containing protein n=1 Tax=Helianthus annuus TaxID=4232 RepID=A0A251UVZ0_HELAN|nr:disease resistance protein RUN1 [Helianthus annuus]KAF5803744.1 putative TIR domain, P-loop containing nucleoside triphosphate hydrolase [Helianthus annuus]KAJ0568388.1 putative TIR domain, P-loop containing nucleoside triphosphate hydrolase [Helianthus annuus]KAJ0916786.1 putative TIR domain, P-loop containing nucleoside triphosphate hydrolase [Helianthus annuus]